MKRLPHRYCARCRTRVRRRSWTYVRNGHLRFLGVLLRPWVIGHSVHEVRHSDYLDVCLDVGVYDVVERLNRDGIETSAACQRVGDHLDAWHFKPGFVNLNRSDLPLLRDWLTQRGLAYSTHELEWHAGAPRVVPPLWDFDAGRAVNGDVDVAIDAQNDVAQLWFVGIDPTDPRLTEATP